MISRLALEERVRQWGLRDEVVEKDYVIGWTLWGIGQIGSLSRAFKGGTCLKKCYIETFRFSEDLDFTVLPGGPFKPEEVEPLLEQAIELVQDASGIDFSRQPPRYAVRRNGASAEGRLYYIGPRKAPTVAKIKLDVMQAEEVVRPTELQPIGHSYPMVPITSRFAGITNGSCQGSVAWLCTALYTDVMKVTITEARQKLPELVRRVRSDFDLCVQITVHGDVAAELRACVPGPPLGAAAKRLRELMSELPAHRGDRRRISESVGEHLYGKRRG